MTVSADVPSSPFKVWWIATLTTTLSLYLSSSTIGTNLGQARLITLNPPLILWIASLYAPESTVAFVASTMTSLLLLLWIALLAPGLMTPITGISYLSSSSESAAAVAVLHATTIILTPRETR